MKIELDVNQLINDHIDNIGYRDGGTDLLSIMLPELSRYICDELIGDDVSEIRNTVKEKIDKKIRGTFYSDLDRSIKKEVENQITTEISNAVARLGENSVYDALTARLKETVEEMFQPKRESEKTLHQYIAIGLAAMQKGKILGSTFLPSQTKGHELFGFIKDYEEFELEVVATDVKSKTILRISESHYFERYTMKILEDYYEMLTERTETFNHPFGKTTIVYFKKHDH